VDEIKQFLKDKGIKQRWLAIKLGVDETQLSRWLNGVNKPNYKIMEKIYDILGIKENIFLTK